MSIMEYNLAIGVVGLIIIMIILRSTPPRKIKEIGFLFKQIFIAVITIIFILKIIERLLF